MNSQSICLNMIVKNESHIIEKTLTNLLQYIQFSYWVICDTGSEDNTKEIITNFFNKNNIPGELIETPWKNFGYNRSFALSKAYEKSDYLFIFDADDKITGDFKLPSQLTYDKYLLKFGPDFTYWRPLLVNNKLPWMFKGVVHEFLCSTTDQFTNQEYLIGNYNVISGREGNRNKIGHEKYLRDAKLLEDALLTEQDQSMINRYWFYTGQSYKDGKQPTKAIPFYEKVINNQCWNQEQYYSCLMLGQIYQSQMNNLEALRYFIMSDKYDPERIEGLSMACEILFESKNYYLIDLIYEDYIKKKINVENKLFVFSNEYNDKIEYYNSIGCYYINKKEKGYKSLKKILINNKLEDELIVTSLSNLEYYTDFFNIDNTLDLRLLFNGVTKIINKKSKFDTITDIDYNIWNKLFNFSRKYLTSPQPYSFQNKSHPKIFISFTTCKRLVLFKQTINSILNTWNDYTNIDYWYCVDDNSSEEDKMEMKKLYPWINYYFKNETEKGHRISMNLIWDKIKSLNIDYWIHMEDDFLFFQRDDYVSKGIKGLQTLNTHNVKQVLFNREYGETINDYNIVSFEPFEEDYCIHIYDKYKKSNKINCYYWPHYSFRPSIIDAKTIINLGNFDSDNTFFELDYANKYTNSGFKSAFLNQISCLHIGRLTSEKNNSGVSNAYSLNNISQFDNQKNKESMIDLETNNNNNNNTCDQNNLYNLSEKYKKILETQFTFIPQLDQINFDVCFLNSIEDCIQKCIDDTNCNAFNTLGFVKSQVSKLEPSNYFSDTDGIYIKKEVHKRILNNGTNKLEEDFINVRKKCILNQNNELVPTNQPVNLIYTSSNFILNYLKSQDYDVNNTLEERNTEFFLFNNYNELLNCYSITCFLEDPYEICANWIINHQYDQIVNYLSIMNKIDKLDVPKNIIYLDIDNLDNNTMLEKINKMMSIDISLHKPVQGLSYLNRVIKDNNEYSLLYNQIHNQILEIKLFKPYEKKFIKMCGNFATNMEIIDEFSIMNENINQFKNIILTPFDKADNYIIINKPKLNHEFYEPSKTIVYQMEPWIYDNNMSWGVKSWKEWATPSENIYLKVFSHKSELNNVQWKIQVPNENEVKIVNKLDKVISILSYKYFDVGHKKRVDYIKYCEKNDNNVIDIYGYENYHKLKNYIGPLQDDKQELELIKYKYTLSIENNSERNYATEKIWEALLCECLPFYWGCPNLEDYIDPRAFIRLDMNDFNKSKMIIENAINENMWEQRIEYIRQEKQKILTKLGFFPRLHNFLYPHSINVDIRVINLERREDRKQHVNNILEIPKLFFTAVDGKHLDNYRTKTELNWFFKDIDEKNKSSNSEIGCKLSHYLVYNEIIKNRCKNDYHLILEDDFIVDKNYKYLLTKLHSEIQNLSIDWDIIYLGGRWSPRFDIDSFCKVLKLQLPIGDKQNYYLNVGNQLYLRNFKLGFPTNYLFRTTHAILISKKGMIKLEKLIRENDFFKSLPYDLFLLKMQEIGNLISLDFFPHIFYSPSDNDNMGTIFNGNIDR